MAAANLKSEEGEGSEAVEAGSSLSQLNLTDIHTVLN